MARIKRNTPERFTLEGTVGGTGYIDFARCTPRGKLSVEIESDGLFYASARQCRAMAEWLTETASRMDVAKDSS